MCPEEKNSFSETIVDQTRFREGKNGIIIEPSKRLVWMKDDTYQLTKKWMSWVQVVDRVVEIPQIQEVVREVPGQIEYVDVYENAQPQFVQQSQ